MRGGRASGRDQGDPNALDLLVPQFDILFIPLPFKRGFAPTGATRAFRSPWTFGGYILEDLVTGMGDED